jgi:hypothetical protein
MRNMTQMALERALKAPHVRLSAAVTVAILSIAGDVVRTAGDPSARELSKRAASYVKWYDQQLLAVVGDESYQQKLFQRGPTQDQERTLRSTVAWVHLPGLNDTVAVREVLEIDGRPAQQSSRLHGLLTRPTEQLETDVRTLLNESAEYNLAEGSRNINFPTFALAYLRPSAGHIKWRPAGRDNGRHVIDFEERGSKTVVRSDTGDRLRARGRIWLDDRSGRIERIDVRLVARQWIADDGPGSMDQSTVSRISYRADVAFVRDERLDLWLPATMTDVYERHFGTTYLRVDGEASYSNYRRFETGGRVVGAP